MRSAIAVNKDEWTARIDALKAEATAGRDLAVKEAGEMEVRLNMSNDTLKEELMSLISHNTKMFIDQRAIDSVAAGKRMDDLTEQMELLFQSQTKMSANIDKMSANMDKMSASKDSSRTPRGEGPKNAPKVGKTPRLDGVSSVADSVAVLEKGTAQADAGTHAPAGM